jgi:hypothetical protein
MGEEAVLDSSTRPLLCLRHGLWGLLALWFGLLFLGGTAPAWADPVTIGPHDIDCIGSTCELSARHDDGDPFKGSITLTVTNTGTEAWGDFHFEFSQIPGGDPIDDVHWVVSSGYEPTKNGSSSVLTWSVDNDVVGATLDLFFYRDPVDPGETVRFVVYSDNTADQVPFFGTAYYPTAVPEPGALALYGLGTLGLAVYGRRRR